MAHRTPRTDDELAALLRERPPIWEYLYYAGVLLAERSRLEPTYRDEVVRYTPLEGEQLDEAAAIARLQGAFDDASALADSAMHLFEPDVHELAFGKPGEEGDEELIRQLAVRTLAKYAELMEWARSLRAARAPSELREAFKLAADMVRLPINQFSLDPPT